MLPVLFESSFFTLYAYPLFMGLAWGVGYYLTRYLFEENKVDVKKLLPLFIGVFVTAWVGAKIFFLIFSSENKAIEYLYANEFWLGGGFVFYGGLIFSLIFYFLYSLYLKKFEFINSKFLVPGLIMGHAVGRIGCFLAGCCYGTSCDLPWAIQLHDELRHPVQLYESIGLFIIGFMALSWIKNKKNNIFVITRYMIFYSSLRFILEYFRGDKIRGLHVFDFSTSQIIAFAMFFGASAVVVFQKFSRESSS